MERIEALVEVLGKFGDALGNVKVLIGDIESEVKTHTKSLKLEIENFKKRAVKSESAAKQLRSEEADLRERLSRLRMEIESLEKSKKENHSTNLSVKSSPLIEEMNEFSDTFSVNSRIAKVASYVNKSIPVQAANAGQRQEWWQNADVSEELEELIDWQKEKAERVQFRMNLMVSEGWRRQNSSFEELQEALRAWTGRLMSWTVVKQGRAARTGKAMFNVKFGSEKDRNKIFAMRKEIAEEGILMVGEALTYVERKERWRMLMMVESLKWTNQVEFENKRICVDGEWWKYVFAEGWRKLGEKRFTPSLRDTPHGEN